MEKKIVQEFFDAWSLYDQVLDNNYLFHQELYRDVQQHLVQYYGDRPLKILDRRYLWHHAWYFEKSQDQ